MKTKINFLIVLAILGINNYLVGQGWMINNTNWTQNNSTYRSSAVTNYEATMI